MMSIEPLSMRVQVRGRFTFTVAFAALLLLSVAGIVIFYLLALVNYLALRRWHESALRGER